MWCTARKGQRARGGSALIGKVDTLQAGGLVGPAPGDIAHRVASAAQDEDRDVVEGQKLQTVGVSLQGEVETAQAVT